MLPVIGPRSGSGEPVPADSRFLRADAVYTPSGAAAIACALREASVGAGDEVLVPAYHCPTMVWPVLACGAMPRFIPMREDLVVTTAHLAALESRRVRAVVLPHFFGCVQPEADAIKRWCEKRGAVLIEDCAHTFYAANGAELPGTVGHFAIASTRKFFAGTEGGALVANDRELKIRLRRASLAEELRCVTQTIQLAREYGGLAWRRASWPLAGRRLEGAADVEGAQAEAMRVAANPRDLCSARADRQACRATQWLIRGEPHSVSAGIRRARWERWLRVVSDLLDVEPFVRRLPSGVVPYVFCVRLRRPGETFPALKYAGVQVWRWDRLAVSGCEISRRLALEVAQLPCQQSLPDAAFERLVQRFAQVLAR